ncbi:MAG: hypothetical protein IKN79_09895 [Eubacterium sp.]|nr:hypothetical protein [Eubacterium sp.]
MRRKTWIILLILAVLLIGGGFYVSTFHLDELEVEGCVLSSPEAIKEAIRQDAPLNNILLLWVKNKVRPIRNIPFVAKLDVEFVDKNTLKVTVYEKSVAGCLEYMDHYVYFDRDGIVLEASVEKKKGVPSINGLDITSWELGKSLPIADPDRFSQILTITQLIEKYSLDIDLISFTKENEIILRHSRILVELGDGKNLTMQMMNLGSILKGLEGKKGTLYMKDFTSDVSTASFKEK